VKRLLEQIRDDWNLLKDKIEINILKKYAWYAKFLTVMAIGKNINFRDVIYMFSDSK
jgi:hypothetical protein